MPTNLALPDDLIETRERLLERAALVGDQELEERLLFDHLSGAGRVFDARNLDDNSVGADGLDDRLRNANAVDARPNRLHGASNRVLLVGHGDALLRVIDLEGEVGAALKVETLLERDTPRDEWVQIPVLSTNLSGLVAWKKSDK